MNKKIWSIGGMWVFDVTGKKSIEYPHCGLLLPIPPRNITMEKLKHMQNVKRFFAHKTKASGVHRIVNPRLIVCAQCGEPMIFTDRFSVYDI